MVCTLGSFASTFAWGAGFGVLATFGVVYLINRYYSRKG